MTGQGTRIAAAVATCMCSRSVKPRQATVAQGGKGFDKKHSTTRDVLASDSAGRRFGGVTGEWAYHLYDISCLLYGVVVLEMETSRDCFAARAVVSTIVRSRVRHLSRLPESHRFVLAGDSSGLSRERVFPRFRLTRLLTRKANAI